MLRYRTRRQSVDEAILTTKRPLTNMQRLGILGISTGIGVSACFMLGTGINEIEDSDMMMGLLIAGFGLAGAFLASRGIWRVAWDVFRRS